MSPDTILEQDPGTVVTQGMEIDKIQTNSISQSDDYNSIELVRQTIKSQLGDLFQFASNNEVDFLFSNKGLLQLLPSIGKHLKNKFGQDTSMFLELLDENPNWQTLFINVNTNIDWATANDFQHEFFENLYELFPSAAEKLNIDFIPHEV